MIGDKEAPFHPHHFEDIEPKPLKIEGSVEQILDSAPISDEFAALAHDELLNMKISSIQPVPMLPPLPDLHAALAHDDSVELARAKQGQVKDNDECESIIEPEAKDENDAQPIRRGLSNILQSVFSVNNRNREEIRTPNPSSPANER